MNKHLLLMMQIIIMTLSGAPISLYAKIQLSKSFKPNWIETLFQLENYHSTENFTSTGKLENLPSSNSFWSSSRFDTDIRYSFSHRLATTLSLNYLNVQANQATLTRYNGGLQELKSGLEYKFPNRYADFILEGLIKISLYKPNESSGLPLYGDGSHTIGTNFWAFQKINEFYWHSMVGLLFRTDGLSGLFPYQLGGHWKFGSWSLGGVLEGHWTLTQDTAGYSKRVNYLRQSNAGSMIFRSPNPNSNFLDLQLVSDITHQFSFKGGIGTSLFGKNSSSGVRYYLGVDIYWEPIINPKNTPPFKNVMHPKSSDEN